MATSITPTLAQLRESIKKEARVKGADNLDSFIDELINELLCDYAINNKPFEFLLTNQPVTTTLNNGTYPLPTNFISMRLVRYKETPTGYIHTLRSRPQYIETAYGQRPRWYDLAGASIILFQADDIPAGDILLLDYYAFPTTLVDATVFPIPRLVAPVKLEAIRRVLIYNQQLQEAQVLKGEAVEKDVRGRHP